MLAVACALSVFHRKPKQTGHKFLVPPSQELGQLGCHSPWEMLCLLLALQRELCAFPAPVPPEWSLTILRQLPLPTPCGKGCDRHCFAKPLYNINNRGLPSNLGPGTDSARPREEGDCHCPDTLILCLRFFFCSIPFRAKSSLSADESRPTTISLSWEKYRITSISYMLSDMSIYSRL